MVHQASSSGVRSIIDDMFELWELQWKLIAVDGAKAKRRSIVAVVMFLAAIVVGIPAITCLLFGLALYLESQFGYDLAIIALTMGAVLTGTILIAGAVGVWMLSQAAAALGECHREMSDNLRWIRASVTGKPTAAHHVNTSESSASAA